MNALHGLKKLAAILAVFTTLFLTSKAAHATHFRYGTMSWTVPDPTHPTTVKIEVETAWRWDFGWPSPPAPAPGITMPPLNSTVPTPYFIEFHGPGGGLVTQVPLNVVVRSVNTAEDWFIGTSEVTMTLPGPGTFQVLVSNCCRLSTLLQGNNDQPFIISTTVVIDPANLILASPRSTTLPVIYVTTGQMLNLPLTSIPPTGNTFRFATTAESGLVTNPPIGMSIDPAGVIHWVPSTVGPYSAQVMIEAARGVRVPVDLIFQVQNVTAGVPPTLLINGSPNPVSFTTEVGVPFSLNVTGVDPDIDPITHGPTVLVLSAGVLPVGAFTTPSLPASGLAPFSSTFRWTPAIGDIGPHIVVFSVIDNTGHQTINSATINVKMNQPPSVICPPPLFVEATSTAGTSVPVVAVVADPDGDPLTTTFTVDGGSSATFPLPPNFTPAPRPVPFVFAYAIGSHTVLVRVSDDHGHAAQCVTPVTVQDTTPPTVSPPADVVAEATSPDGANVAYPAASATDVVDGSVATICSPPSGALFALGLTLVTCSATDASGNTGHATFRVTVQDTTPPAITDVPADVVLEATSPAGTAFSYGTPVASDIVSGPVAVFCTPSSGSVFGFGTTTVSCSAIDGAGNTASATFHVTVQDTKAPVLSGLPGNQTIEATGPSGAAALWTPPTAFDIVSGDVPVSCSATPGSVFPLGTTVVTCGALDQAGNTAQGSFSITVQDTTPPAISGVPGDLKVEATSSSGAVVSYATPTATDLVSGTVPVSCVPPSGATFPLGLTTVNCTATDGASNSAHASFTVLVRDSTPPVIVSVTPSSGSLWPPDHRMVDVAIEVIKTDLDPSTSCSVVSVSSNEPIDGLGDGDMAPDWTLPGGLHVQVRAERSGKGNGRTYTVTVACVDGSGNRSTASTSVSVPKSQGH